MVLTMRYDNMPRHKFQRIKTMFIKFIQILNLALLKTSMLFSFYSHFPINNYASLSLLKHQWSSYLFLTLKWMGKNQSMIDFIPQKFIPKFLYTYFPVVKENLLESVTVILDWQDMVDDLHHHSWVWIVTNHSDN